MTFAGLLGLLVATSPERVRNALAALLVAYAGFHAASLHQKHDAVANGLGSTAEFIGQIERVRDAIEPGAHLLLINQPGSWLRAQFARDVLPVALDDPDLRVSVLTLMPGQEGPSPENRDRFPGMGAGLIVRKLGSQRIAIEGIQVSFEPRPQPVHEPVATPFRAASLVSGTRRQADGLRVTITSGDEGGAMGLEIETERPIETYTLLVWDLDVNRYADPPWERRRDAFVRIVDLASP